MAKIDTIKLNINGKEFSYNINVGKAGIFKCNIDWNVAKILGMETGTLTYSSLSDLKSEVLGKYHDYLERTSNFELFIGIEYKASRSFVEKNNGNYMFGRSTNFYDDATRWGIGSSIVFGYEFYIKETASTGLILWYKAKKVDLDYELNTFEKVFEGFVFSSTTHSTNGKLIPYSQQAEETLKKGKEGLRMISETLFNFVNQDEKLIEASLLGGNLLSQ